MSKNKNFFPMELPSASVIAYRLRQKPSLGEVFGVLFGVLLSIGFVYIRLSQGFDLIEGIDFGIFIASIEGDYEGFYYPNWSIPLFWLVSLLQSKAVMYVVWNTINVLGIAFAARVFGGNSLIALISYQMLFSLYFGQIVGVLVAGMAFYFWMLQRDKPLLAGVGAVFALIKPQVSIPILIVLGLLASDTWRKRILSTLPAFAALGISLLVWDNWVADLWTRSQANPPMEAGSIALWQYIGAWSLLLWIPVVLLPMSPMRRLIVVTAATSIATPYYIHNGLLSLFVLPIGWLGLLGNLGYLMVWFGWLGVKFTAIAPLAAYGWVVGLSLRDWLNKRGDAINEKGASMEE